MENERIAKLEVEVSHLRADTTEIKGDVKSDKTNFKISGKPKEVSYERRT